MKKIVIWVLFAGLLVTTAGCGRDGSRGRDGQDGKVYIAYSWAVSPFYYTTNDPGIPSYVINNYYYQSIPGTYSGAYISWDGSQWPFTYTLTANKGTKGKEGEKGGIFWQNGNDGADGQDGADKYYVLSCLSFGWTLYSFNYAVYSSMSLGHTLADKEAMDISKSGQPALPMEERNQWRGIRMP